MSDKKIACVAAIGPDNNPILLKSYCIEKRSQEIDTLLFCSLDYFENSIDSDPKSKSTNQWLGNLQTSDRFQIWGYKTNLNYKIVVFTFHNVPANNEDMKALCEKIKKIIFSAFMDPFYQPFTVIKSESIYKQIDALCQGQ